MARKHLEQTLHTEIARFLAIALSPRVVWTTVPIGGGGAIRGAILAGMGTRKGWPDLQLVHDGRIFLIEIKTAKGRLSAAQQQCHADLIAAGSDVAVARSVDDVHQLLIDWQIPTRLSSSP